MADSPLPKQRTGKKPRGEGRRFEQGQSGNPKGRKAGTRCRATMFGEHLIEAEAEVIIKATIAAALAGDPTATRLMIERLMPLRRGRPVVFAMPELNSADDVGAAIAAVALAMSRGELTPEEATAVAGVIELRRRAIETSEFEKRLKALEDGDHGERH